MVVVLVVTAVVVVVAPVVVVVAPELVSYNEKYSIDHQLGLTLAVRTTWTYCSLWAGKLTVTGYEAGLQLATVVQLVPSAETLTFMPLG